MRKKLLLGLMVGSLLAISLAGCSSSNSPPANSAPAAAPTAAPANADLEKRVTSLEDFVKVQKVSVNPGLGTVMLEYSQRMAKLYFAGQAEAWDEARYQILEMTEIQETGEVDRPKRADALKKFESTYLDPLQATIKSKDKAGFLAAYTKAVEGCNTCHVETKSDDFPNGYGWVKFVVPKASPVDFQDLAAK